MTGHSSDARPVDKDPTTPVVPFDIVPGLTVGDGAPLLVIAGPCQIESRDHALFMAEALATLCRPLPVSLVYKSSFDKANRTSVSAARGPGVDEGLRILEDVRRATGLPVLTDVHTEAQAAAAGPVVDVLQIPAFLCRQTDLLVAAGRTGKTVNVKKGQFLHPADMKFSAEKVAAGGSRRVMLCERGSCFGHRDLVVDMRGLPAMRGTGRPVVFDGTHSVQSMGGAGGSSSGERRFVAPLVRAAVAAGVDGVFLECHEDPSRAPSDGAVMLPLPELRSVLGVAVRVREAVAGGDVAS